jgi:hypothetical protein
MRNFLFLFVILLGLPQLSNAQYRRKYNENEYEYKVKDNTSGDELMKAGKKYMKGMTFQLLGIGVSSLYFAVGDVTHPDGSKDSQLKYIAAGTGGVLFLTGTIIQITSWGNIMKAGRKMNEYERDISLNFSIKPTGGSICLVF